jgi:hypothetical protein
MFYSAGDPDPNWIMIQQFWGSRFGYGIRIKNNANEQEKKSAFWPISNFDVNFDMKKMVRKVPFP